MARPLEEFALTAKRQKAWGWPIAVALFLAAVGSGLFLISLLVERVMGVPFDFGLILGIGVGGIATSAAFVFDLGRKGRFWRVLLRPGKSWISRGIILISMFVIFGLLYAVPGWWSWLPWTKETGLGQALMVIAALGAFGTMFYSGFVLSYSLAISIWNTNLLPILCVAYAFLAGIAMMFIMNSALGEGGINFSLLKVMEMSLIIFTMVLFFAYLMTTGYAGTASREATMLLVKGRLAWVFWGGVIAIGLLLPLLITGYTYINSDIGAPSVALLATAGVLELSGGLLFRYSLLRAGVFARVA
ncbi:MAG: polysulfide reductase NrfD [Chloroflexi bacterium]|nr:polysulfide reductase NrfD [Chloroflexota bacterium]